MFGHNKKEIKKPEQEKKNYDVKTIPDEFYGGQNPKIEFKNVKKEVDLDRVKKKSASPSPVRKKEAEAFNKKNAKGGIQKAHPANLFTSWKFLLLLSAGLFILVGIVAAVYYGYTSYKQNKTKTPVPVVTTVTTKVDTTVVTTSPTVVTTTISATTTATSSLSKNLLIYPSLLLGKGVDLDGDKLSDKAEAIFGTDASIIDSDKDKFPDGHEVYYLYNPTSSSPKKLIDSNLIKEYTNTNYNYKLYYPSNWIIGDVASNKSDVLFTSTAGESVQVKVYSLSPTDTFDSWFKVYAKGENNLTLNDFTSVFKQKGKYRSDKLVYYFIDGRRVYVILYVAGTGNVANYDSIIEMMARSFHTGVNTFVKVWAGDSTTSTATSTKNSTTSL